MITQQPNLSAPMETAAFKQGYLDKAEGREYNNTHQLYTEESREYNRGWSSAIVCLAGNNN
jgi:hypothetical protein